MKFFKENIDLILVISLGVYFFIILDLFLFLAMLPTLILMVFAKLNVFDWTGFKQSVLNVLYAIYAGVVCGINKIDMEQLLFWKILIPLVVIAVIFRRIKI